MIEKRAEPRYALDDEVSLAAPNLGTHLAQIMDASAHGLRVRYGADLAPGTPVKVRLDFLDPSHQKENPVFVGEVMHRFAEPGGGSWQVGIRLRFHNTDEEALFLKILHQAVGVETGS